ncbi:MAG TPA: ABC transporter permease [Candidatus Bathyarchaeia archaeon]|nr:ABC transporter permease [Candidatus Bathyarchaeia archaeon]
MNPLDLFHLAFKALIDRKIRSALTILGIMIGGALIMALIASSAGLGAGVQAQVAKIGANTLIVRAGSANYVSGSRSAYLLSTTDIPRLAGIPDVQQVIPYYSKGVTVTVGGQSISATFKGVDPKQMPNIYHGLALDGGGFPSSFDPTSAAIGNGIAFPVANGAVSDQLVGLNQALSLKISGSTTSLTFLVRGILAPYGSALFDNVDLDIFVGLDAAQILLKTPYYSGFYVMVDSTDNVPNVQLAIQTLYGSNVNIISAGSIASSITAITSQMTVFLGSIGGVSLVVAAVGITNTMYVAVIERTREIGVLKALGFNRSQIMSMFLSEAVVTGIFGGIFGTMAGYGLAFVLGGALNFSGGGGGRGIGGVGQVFSSTGPIFTPQLIIFSLLFPIGLTVVAGLYPAWLASRMNPIDALKYE